MRYSVPVPCHPGRTEASSNFSRGFDLLKPHPKVPGRDRNATSQLPERWLTRQPDLAHSTPGVGPVPQPRPVSSVTPRPARHALEGPEGVTVPLHQLGLSSP
eukprot:8756294-Pyramimonas_sp.AAC.1